MTRSLFGGARDTCLHARRVRARGDRDSLHVFSPNTFLVSSSSSTTFTMSDLPGLLLASLNPDSRKQAEQNLHALSQQPGFLPVLLRLVLEASQDRSVRLAASVFFKNVVKNKWEDVCLASSRLRSTG